MKAIWFFYLGAGIDLVALLIAVYFMLSDQIRGISGTNNPLMLVVTLSLAAMVGAAFWLKSIGKISAANLLLWIPGLPLAGYGVMILLFVIFKPDMR